jgi:hypothetical protein
MPRGWVLEDADADSGRGVAAVLFEVELSFEGVVDRLDDLAEWSKELAPVAGWLALAGGAQRGQSGVGQ